VKYVATIAMVALLLTGCKFVESDRDFLKKQGYTQVKMLDEQVLDIRCGPPDMQFVDTRFEAINLQGKKVTGSVCHFVITHAVED